MPPFPSATKTYRDKAYPTISPDRPELSAKGKSVLITGGGTGIGAETALRFAQAGAARIAILGRRESPLIETKTHVETQYPDSKVFTAVTDVTVPEQVKRAFQDFLGDSKLDIVISNAAAVGPLEGVRDVDPAAFLEGINVNVSGALNVAQAFLKHCASDAVAIETNSSAAHVNFAPAFVSYTVAKLATFRLWDSVAFAYPRLRVYHVQPGVVVTDMNRSTGGAEATGAADDVDLPACFYVWLASPEGEFLKGKYLWANWDADELMAERDKIVSTQYLDIGLVGWPFGTEGWSFKVAEGAEADSAFRAA